MVVSDGVSGPSVSSRTRSKKRAATVQEEKLRKVLDSWSTLQRVGQATRALYGKHASRVGDVRQARAAAGVGGAPRAGTVGHSVCASDR